MIFLDNLKLGLFLKSLLGRFEKNVVKLGSLKISWEFLKRNLLGNFENLGNFEKICWEIWKNLGNFEKNSWDISKKSWEF